MKVYRVSPILKYSPFFTLTYVSKFDFEVGNVVHIDFNNRKIFGIVLEVFDLKDAKVEIRKSDFKTKKIEEDTEKEIKNFFSKKDLEIYKNFSEQFGIPVGEIIYYIYGNDFNPPESPGEKADLVLFPDDLSLKTSNQENSYKGSEIFKKVLNDEVETLTIKDFNFDTYINFQVPHISKLDLLFLILENHPVKKIIVETDFLGTIEAEWLKKTKLNVEVKEKRNKAKKFLVKTGRDENGEEIILAEEALEKISTPPSLPSKEGRNKKTFMFVLSHGFADRIFCQDCKHSYDCENCGHPFSILNEEEGRFLYCKNCKNKKILKDDQYLICKKCGSWRVFPFGLGGQKVFEFLKKHNIDATLIDEAQKKLSPKKILSEIKNSKNILIGSLRTLRVLQNIGEYVDKTFVISTGPLVKGKFFDSDERLMKLISEIENISKEVYINKREGDEVSLDNYKNKEKFLQEELMIRKSAELPPYSKVLSFIFPYKYKRHVDSFLNKLPASHELKQGNGETRLNESAFGQVKKGGKYIYYWFVPKERKVDEIAHMLRQFGDVFVANSVIEQSILGK